MGFLGAVQKAVEEFSMKVNGKGGLELIAREGAWGTLLMLVVACPLLWFLPGNDHGHVEDFIDTFVLLKTNYSFVWLIPALQVSTATLKVFHTLTTKHTNSVHTWLLDSLRCAVVWAFGLSVHYLWDRTSVVGESWTLYSYLQCGGFSLLIFGQLVYSDLVVLPFFESRVMTNPTASATLAQE